MKLISVFANFPDFEGFPRHPHIEVHNMEYDGRGKVQILQKFIKIECEIIL